MIKVQLSPAQTDYSVSLSPNETLCVLLPAGAFWDTDTTLGLVKGSTSSYCTPVGGVGGAFGLSYLYRGKPYIASIFCGVNGPPMSFFGRIADLIQRIF